MQLTVKSMEMLKKKEFLEKLLSQKAKNKTSFSN